MTSTVAVTNDVKYECCPLCGCARISVVGDIDYPIPLRFSTAEVSFALDPELWRCLECDSSFVQNVMPENIATELYSSGASGDRWPAEEFTSQKPANQIVCINRYFRRDASVLDIGCNTGELLDYAKARGCTTTGVEYSEASRRVLADKKHGAFAELSDVNAVFDVITAFDLVEHFYDARGFFEACRSKLKNGGVLIILTGDIGSLSARLSGAKWWYLKYPEHVVFPSKTFFRTRLGLRLERWVRTYASKGYKVRWSTIMRQSLIAFLRGTYAGLPSIGPDHVLVVLKNDQ